ncbi:Spectrin beta chain, non-erythrocytic 5 [Tyrophagus putrescentiae]|nr:Spectrin beta chain, non-erythrocytic 5 [Tyrophagus putrescentiae]
MTVGKKRNCCQKVKGVQCSSSASAKTSTCGSRTRRGVISNEDGGRDLTSVKNLLKKHLLVENDVSNHNENIKQVKDHLLNFTQSKHFLREEIEERAGATSRTSCSGSETQYDSGATLADTQRLLKQLKMFESELHTREPHLSALRIQQLKNDCSLCRLRLVDALGAQQFYADLAKEESWLS